MRLLTLTLPGFGGKAQLTSPAKSEFKDIGSLVSGFSDVIFYISFILLFLWMLWGVFKYITAEGQKEALFKARNHIRWAMVGFVVIMLAFVFSRYAKDLVVRQQPPVTPVTEPATEPKTP